MFLFTHTISLTLEIMVPMFHGSNFKKKINTTGNSAILNQPNTPGTSSSSRGTKTAKKRKSTTHTSLNQITNRKKRSVGYILK